ncbi:MAG: beta-N-acetylhexosaminidase [Chloroflexi bacterium]|nr:beta-N-acetylhexosaminidase [Chloroflexota bacterium]
MLNLEQQVGQRLMAGFDGLAAPDYILEWLAAGRIGGIILFQRNVESPEQLAALTASLHGAAMRPILIAIDQEGGEVARLRRLFAEAPSAMALAAGGGRYAEAVAHTLGAEMRALGINQNYAPVVDVVYNAANPTVGTRSPGADIQTVARIAAAQVKGYQDSGVAATAKHFPGLGDTAIDTHVALATINAPLETIEADLLPYRTVIEAGLAAVMTTHTVFAALDARLPATLSPVIVPRLLREHLGYEGVVTTDCMEMKAIASHHEPEVSAVLAAQADVDIILFSHTREAQERAYYGLLAAAQDGRVSAESMAKALTRIEAMKARYAVTERPDPGSIRSAEHLGLMVEAARAGTQQVHARPGVLPITADKTVALIEFASLHDSEVFDATGHTSFAGKFAARRPDAQVIALPQAPSDDELQQAMAASRAADVTIMATRSAHLNPSQLYAAQLVLDAAQTTVLLALRNPFDAGVLPEVDAAVVTFGGAEPQLDAAVGALLGDFIPTGVSPVELGT